MKRRALLKALPAVAVLPAMAAVPALASPARLEGLIEAHRSAYERYRESWAAYCKAHDERSPLLEEICDQNERDMDAAEADWQRIIDYRPQSVDECMMIAAYAVEQQKLADASESWCYRELLQGWKEQAAA